MGHEKYVPLFPLLDLSFISSAVLLLLTEKIKPYFVSRFDGLDLIIYTIFSPITQTLDTTPFHTHFNQGLRDLDACPLPLSQLHCYVSNTACIADSHDS